jgi:hypothetical protein
LVGGAGSTVIAVGFLAAGVGLRANETIVVTAIVATPTGIRTSVA